jgi:hypothetical protein
MAKISRKVAKIFGSTAGPNQIAKFGSLAAGTPLFSTDPAVIQALGNWLQGWFAGVEGASSPAIEDMNAFCYVAAYQIAYQMQTGVPEWDATTTYFIGSLVTDVGTGAMYMSKVNNNLNNALPTGPLHDANWILYANQLANTRARDYSINGSDPGLGGVSTNVSTGTFNGTSSTFTNITNCSCTLTTSGLRPVVIKFISDGTISTLGTAAGFAMEGIGSSGVETQIIAEVQILESGTPYYYQKFGIEGNFGASGHIGSQIPPGAFNATTYPPTTGGTYTYTAQYRIGGSSGTSTFFASKMKMMVYEED